MSDLNDVIKSSQNKYVSLARGLSNRKKREESALFRFDGIKLMCEAQRSGVELDFVLVCEGFEDDIFEKSRSLYGIDRKDLDCRIVVVSRQIFENLTEENAPEGVISVAKYCSDIHKSLEEYSVTDFDKNDKILLLDSVRDPQNVGAIIRVAAAFGVDRIIMGRDCADIYNSKTVRASMGTLFGIRIDRVSSVQNAIVSLISQGRRVFAATLDGRAKRLGDFEIKKGDCVVIGNEGHGLSRETVCTCSESVFIPMSEQVESLNAATAAAVLVWEFFGFKPYCTSL